MKNSSSVIAQVSVLLKGSETAVQSSASAQSFSLAAIILSVSTYHSGFPSARWSGSTTLLSFLLSISSGQKELMEIFSGSLKSTSCLVRYWV